MDAIGSGAGYPNDDVQGFLAAPGTYTVSLSKRMRGETTELVGPQEFQVERLRKGALDGAEPTEIVAFWDRLAKLQRGVTAAQQATNHLEKKVADLKVALGRTRSAPEGLDDQWHALQTELMDIKEILSGNQAMASVGQDPQATLEIRLGKVLIGTAFSTYGPTPTHIQTLEYAETDFSTVRSRLNTLQQATIPAFSSALIEAGAPWTPGDPVPEQ